MKRLLHISTLITDNRLLVQLLRYVSAGAGVYVIDLLSFLAVLAVLPTAHIAANIIAKLLGAASGFLLHKYFTYRWTQARRVEAQAAGYVLVLGFNLCLASGLLFLGVDVLRLPTLPVKIAVDVVVIAMTFVLTRSIVFKRKD